MGSGNYAVGRRAVAICERCSAKRLRKELVYDGQQNGLLVCPECWDPKHPQEYLPALGDPTVIYDPTGDTDRLQNQVTVNFPPLWSLQDKLSSDLESLPLRYHITIKRQAMMPGGPIYGET